MKINKKIIPGIVFGCSIIFVLVCMVNYSPIFTDCYLEYHSGSSVDGIIIGKYWKTGSVPYLDLFAISGPFVYLLNLLSWFVDLRVGGFFLQCILIFGMLWCIYSLFHKYWEARHACLISMISSIFFLGLFSYGDMESEVAFALILFMIFLSKRNPIRNGNLQNFLLGFILGLALMTNISVFLMGNFVLLAHSTLTQREPKQKLKNGLFVMLGVFASLLPFLVYFYFQNALKDMLVAYRLQGIYLIEGFSSLNEFVRRIIIFYSFLIEIIPPSFQKVNTISLKS